MMNLREGKKKKWNLGCTKDVNIVFQVLWFPDASSNCIANPEFIKLFSRVKLICKHVRIQTKFKKQNLWIRILE